MSTLSENCPACEERARLRAENAEWHAGIKRGRQIVAEAVGNRTSAPAAAVAGDASLIELAEALESERRPGEQHYINRAAAALRKLAGA